MAGIEKGVGFPITATDQFSGAFDKLKGKVTEAQGGFERLKGLATAAVAGISVAGFATLIKSAIDAADELGKLSQKTGIAVEQLSALKYAADLSGVGSEALGKGIKQLSAQMVEAGDSTSKASRVFKAMGVDLKGGPMAVLAQVADVFKGLEDDEVKTTLATQLFGKAGMELIPMLNQGKDGLQKLKEEAQRLGLILNEETTKAAEQFNDNLRAIEQSSKAAGYRIFNDMAPALVRITEAMKEAAMEGGLLKAAIVALGGALAELYGLNDSGDQRLAASLKKYQDERDALHEMARAGAELLPGEQAHLDFLDREIAKLEKVRQAREKLANLDKGGPFAGGVLSGSAVNSRAIASALAGGAAGGPTDFERMLATATKDLSVARAELANGTDHLTVSEKKLIEIEKDVAWEKLTKQQKERIQGLYDEAIAAEKTGRSIAFLRAEEEKNQAVRDAQGQTLSDLEESWRVEAENLEQEADLIGLSNSAREKAILLMKKEQDLQLVAGLKGLDPSDRATAVKAIEDSYTRMIAAIDNKEFKENQLSFWTQLGDLAGGFANALTHGVGSAFDYLKQQAKQLLAEMIAIFAKRWVLQLAAGATTGAASTALYAASGQVGQGSLGGSLLSAGGSYFGFGSTGATAAGEGAFAGGTIEGIAGNSILNGAGAMIAEAIPVLGWIAAAYTLWQTFKDKGENWQGQLGFGANAHAYSTTGPFGAEGFNFVQGQDATNQQMQAFFAASHGIDAHLAAHLTPEQIASITGSLGGSYATRNDGQPSTFAFGPGDSTAAQQFTLEFLQKKYGTIFDTIDKKFADFIRSYTGDSAGLMQAIGDFAAVMDALQDSPVPGLNIESLRAMQREGEKLNDTFNAVTSAWSQYVDLFYSGAEKQQMGMDALHRQFTALGIEMPATREAFRTLVESVDHNSPLFRSLIELAPAFAALIPPMQDIIDLAAAVGNPLGRGGVANALGRGTVGAFAFGHVGSGATAAGAASGNPGDGLTGGMGEAATAAIDLANALQQTKDSLGLFLRDLASNPSLSPLDPKGQLDSATASFWSDLAAARAGDPAAAARIQGDLTNALTLGHTNYASGSQYIDLFDTLTSAAGSFANAPSTGTQTVALLTTTNLTLGDIKEVLIAIRDGQELSAVHVADATTASGQKVVMAVTSAEPAPR